MKLKNIRKNLKKPGAIKAVVNRTRADLGYGTFAMMLYLSLKAGLDWYWFMLIPAYALFKLKDIDRYHGQEAEYNFEKSPPMVRLYKMVREIHKKVGDNSAKLKTLLSKQYENEDDLVEDIKKRYRLHDK